MIASFFSQTAIKMKIEKKVAVLNSGWNVLGVFRLNVLQQRVL